MDPSAAMPKHRNPPVKERLLIVEDDSRVAAALVRGLKDHGFWVELTMDGTNGLDRALSGEFDAVLLDLNLPGLTGFEVLQRCAGRLSIPIVVLSARTDLQSRLQVFDQGAVDFVAKPFWMEELVARLRARLAPKPAEHRIVGFAGVLVDLDARTATQDGRSVDLTAHEFNLLAWLVERPGRAVTRRQLIEAALPHDSDAQDRTVDSHITRIRKKLGDAGGCIHTVWRVGYRFLPPES